MEQKRVIHNVFLIKPKQNSNPEISGQFSLLFDQLKLHYGDNITIDMDMFNVPSHESICASCGLIILAETTTGCLLAKSALGEKRVSSEQVAKEAVDSLTI